MIEDRDFDSFWSIYPRRVAKAAARRMWDRALKSTTPQVILDAARRYAQERAREDPKFTKHPATWLNGGCWEDEQMGRTNGRQFNERSILGALDRLESILENGPDYSAGESPVLGLPSR